MTNTHKIVRIAAKGDGITADGVHHSGTVPGDYIADSGEVIHGPHHTAPPCRHFAKCGGCQLQYADDHALAQFVSDRVRNAAHGQDIDAGVWAPPHLSAPKTRRRATLHAVNGGGRPRIGFREGRSHKVVDLQECHILRPELFALIEPLRRLLSDRTGRYAVDIELTLLSEGVDLGLGNLSVEGLQQTEAILDFARDNNLARLTLDHGYGAEAVWEPQPASVSLSGVSVPFPSGAFLQATQDGEAALVGAAREWLDGCKTAADLFSGLGTFAFALAKPMKVLAAEASRDLHFACKSAAGAAGIPVHSIHRDLFRNPLTAEELNRFDAVLLDPPRAGARDQIEQLAHSTVERIVYISCNPASWAKDAKALVGAGYILQEVRPVGQFRWSTHVELASVFTR